MLWGSDYMGSGPLNPLVTNQLPNMGGAAQQQQPQSQIPTGNMSAPINPTNTSLPVQASTGSTAPYTPLSGLGIPMSMGGGSLGPLGSNSTIAPNNLRTK
ncbi:MAG: hypothetical protein KGJ90_01910 [Patescibacteria group bacterium]|nr:hypothetical protein [Patescibacteria group bacterium]